MAVQCLVEAGFGAAVAANTVLDNAPDGQEADMAQVRLCCLSVIEEGASVAAVRFFVRRIQRKMPQAGIVVGLWGAAADSPVLAMLREDGGEAHVSLSIGELLAYVKVAAAERTP